MADLEKELLWRIRADISDFNAKIDQAETKLTGLGASATTPLKGVSDGMTTATTATSRYAAELQKTFGLNDSLSRSEVTRIRSLQNEIAAVQLSGREYAAYTAVRKAGSAADSEAAGLISGLAKAHYDLSQGVSSSLPALASWGQVWQAAPLGLKNTAVAVENVGNELRETSQVSRMFNEGFVALNPLLATAGSNMSVLVGANDRFGASFASAATTTRTLGTELKAIDPALAALNTEQAASVAVTSTWRNLWGLLPATMAQASTATVAAGSAARTYASEASGAAAVTHDFRIAAHAAHPIISELGASTGVLGQYASAARGGIIALGVAITGGLLVAVSNAADRIATLKDRLASLSSDTKGGQLFGQLSKAADEAGVSIATLQTGFEGLIVAQQQADRASGIVYGDFKNIGEQAAATVKTIAQLVYAGGGLEADTARVLTVISDSFRQNGKLTVQAFEQVLAIAPRVAAELAKQATGYTENSTAIAAFEKRIASTNFTLNQFQQTTRAMSDRADDLAEDHIPTLRQAWEKLGTAMGKVFEAAGEGGAFSGLKTGLLGLSQLLLSVAGNADVAAIAIGGLSAVLAGAVGGALLGYISKWTLAEATVARFGLTVGRLALLGTASGLVAVAIEALDGPTMKLAESLGMTEQGARTLLDTLELVGAGLMIVFGGPVGWVAGAITAFGPLMRTINEVIDGLARAKAAAEARTDPERVAANNTAPDTGQGQGANADARGTAARRAYLAQTMSDDLKTQIDQARAENEALVARQEAALAAAKEARTAAEDANRAVLGTLGNSANELGNLDDWKKFFDQLDQIDAKAKDVNRDAKIPANEQGTLEDWLQFFNTLSDGDKTLGGVKSKFGDLGPAATDAVGTVKTALDQIPTIMDRDVTLAKATVNDFRNSFDEIPGRVESAFDGVGRAMDQGVESGVIGTQALLQTFVSNAINAANAASAALASAQNSASAAASAAGSGGKGSYGSDYNFNPGSELGYDYGSATGGVGVVPHGYQNDSFPAHMMLTEGETVIVIPAGKSIKQVLSERRPIMLGGFAEGGVVSTGGAVTASALGLPASGGPIAGDPVQTTQGQRLLNLFSSQTEALTVLGFTMNDIRTAMAGSAANQLPAVIRIGTFEIVSSIVVGQTAIVAAIAKLDSDVVAAIGAIPAASAGTDTGTGTGTGTTSTGTGTASPTTATPPANGGITSVSAKSEAPNAGMSDADLSRIAAFGSGKTADQAASILAQRQGSGSKDNADVRAQQAASDAAAAANYAAGQKVYADRAKANSISATSPSTSSTETAVGGSKIPVAVVPKDFPSPSVGALSEPAMIKGPSEPPPPSSAFAGPSGVDPFGGIPDYVDKTAQAVDGVNSKLADVPKATDEAAKGFKNATETATDGLGNVSDAIGQLPGEAASAFGGIGSALASGVGSGTAAALADLESLVNYANQADSAIGAMDFAPGGSSGGAVRGGGGSSGSRSGSQAGGAPQPGEQPDSSGGGVAPAPGSSTPGDLASGRGVYQNPYGPASSFDEGGFGGGDYGATGGIFDVPGGFPNDTWTLHLSTGETAVVVPAGATLGDVLKADPVAAAGIGGALAPASLAWSASPSGATGPGTLSASPGSYAWSMAPSGGASPAAAATSSIVLPQAAGAWSESPGVGAPTGAPRLGPGTYSALAMAEGGLLTPNGVNNDELLMSMLVKSRERVRVEPLDDVYARERETNKAAARGGSAGNTTIIYQVTIQTNDKDSFMQSEAQVGAALYRATQKGGARK